MALPEVSREQLESAHRALRITIPLDEVHGALLDTLTILAHRWATKGMPKNLYPEPPRREGTAALRQQGFKTKPSDVDLKRRASGDND